jgi:hypothetical protein
MVLYSIGHQMWCQSDGKLGDFLQENKLKNGNPKKKDNLPNRKQTPKSKKFFNFNTIGAVIMLF